VSAPAPRPSSAFVRQCVLMRPIPIAQYVCLHAEQPRPRHGPLNSGEGRQKGQGARQKAKRVVETVGIRLLERSRTAISAYVSLVSGPWLPRPASERHCNAPLPLFLPFALSLLPFLSASTTLFAFCLVPFACQIFYRSFSLLPFALPLLPFLSASTTLFAFCLFFLHSVSLRFTVTTAFERMARSCADSSTRLVSRGEFVWVRASNLSQ